MTLHRIRNAAEDLMALTESASWNSMDGAARKEALERARAIEGRIRELAALHNAALLALVRQRHGIPHARPLHINELPWSEQLAEMMEEITLPGTDECIAARPDERSHGLPENVAAHYHFGRMVGDQAAFLASGADSRHEHRREELEERNLRDHMQGLA